MLTSDEFWLELKELGVVPKDLDHVVFFFISGQPNRPLEMYIHQEVYDEDAENMAKTISRYRLVEVEEDE